MRVDRLAPAPTSVFKLPPAWLRAAPPSAKPAPPPDALAAGSRARVVLMPLLAEVPALARNPANPAPAVAEMPMPPSRTDTDAGR